MTRVTIWLLIQIGLAVPAWAQIAEIKHVVVIGCDGLTSAGLLGARTPNIDELKTNGVYTLHAQSVLPTISIPNWASLLMGAGPEQHGAKKNGWSPHPIRPKKCGGITKGFPTIYTILSEQHPEFKSAMFHNWDGLQKIVKNDKLDELKNCKSPEKIVKCAVQYFQTRKPDFVFVYLNLIDEAGHQNGYGSKEYIKAIEKADRLIGDLLKGLRKAEMLESSAIFLASDHGGRGKSHGDDSKAERETPWILSGAGIVHGKELTTTVHIYDTAATIAYIFGVTPPVCWIGVPIKEAFTSETP